MISICIIVKNEQENLQVCLERLAPTGFEIVIADTGSSDNTKEIARKYTDYVYDFEWEDDFSKARNFIMGKASNDFIMMVDSDEFLTDINIEELKYLILKNPEAVGRIHRNNIFFREDNGFQAKEQVNRIFSKQHYRYYGRIHEQIERMDRKEYETYSVPVFFDHSGYDGSLEKRSEKSERNLHLLKRMLEEDGADPYVLYQLAKAYYMKRDYDSAVIYFREALTFDLDTRLEYVIDMVEIYAYALIKTKQYREALLLENIYDEFSHSADFVFVMGLIYMENGMFEKALQEFEKVVKFADCKVQGVNSHLAYYNMGVMYECMQEKGKALNYYKKCDGYQPALQGIDRCTK